MEVEAEPEVKKLEVEGVLFNTSDKLVLMSEEDYAKRFPKNKPLVLKN